MLRRVQSYRSTNELRFSLNGELVTITNPDPEVLLVDWLRHSGHTGTKFSCGQGGCGACVVMVRKWGSRKLGLGETEYLAINSCLQPLVAMHGMDVTTVEGLGSSTTTIDPVQDTIAKFNGSQCGYCSPGFVMGMKAYLQNTQHCQETRTQVDIEAIADGHICRCTGFRPILCGLKTFAKDGNEWELKHTPPCVVDPSFNYSSGELSHSNVTLDYWEQEAESAVEEVDAPQPQKEKHFFTIHSHKPEYPVSWDRPITLDQLWHLLKTGQGNVRLVVGNTASGLQPYQSLIKKMTRMIFIADIPELTEMRYDGVAIYVRAAVPIYRLFNLCKMLTETVATKEARSSYPPEVAYNHFKRLATTELRNVASVAGNLYLAKKWGFPSDLHIVLTTLSAQVVIKGADPGNEETYNMIDFLQDEARLDNTNIIFEIRVPMQAKHNVFIRTFKIAKRAQNSHPVVNAGFSMNVRESEIVDVCIVLGNITHKNCRMHKTEKWIEANCNPRCLATQFPELLSQLESELHEKVEEEHSDRQFRVNAARNLFFKYLVELADVFRLPGWKKMPELQSSCSSLMTWRMNTTSSGQQDFRVFPKKVPVSEPIIKQTAFLQTTGEAKYTQDIGMQAAHLSGVYILNVGKNATAYGKFKFSFKPADIKRKFPAVVKVFTAEDLKDTETQLDYRYRVRMENLNKSFQHPHRHSLADHVPVAVPHDDPYYRNNIGRGQWGYPGDTVFAHEKVIYIGQPLGMVVAKTEAAARDCAEWIQENCIHYTPLSCILTLEEAIQKKNFFYDADTLPCAAHGNAAPSRISKVSRPPNRENIDWERLTESGLVIVEGSQRTGSQYHFYMETQSAIAFPEEGGHLKIFASTQSPTGTQKAVAHVCDLPMNAVEVEITRLGGGYGGKEPMSKFTATAAAFCAQQLKQSVRVANSRVEDMQMIGKRHAIFGHYKVAATKNGKIVAMQVHFYADAGCTYDASFPVMDLILLTADNAYNIPEFIAKGDCAMTMKSSSTAFRSFGVVQAMLVVEAAIEATAERLGIPDDKLREMNFYRVDEYTPYGQQLHYCNLSGVWEKVKESAEYEKRREEVNTFNRQNRYKKRGIKMIPMKYGISFTTKMKNQGGAFINVYSSDGTVLVSHGGVEMGQGINTKMMQIASLTLDIPMHYLKVTNMSTSKIPNTSSTGGSTGTDLNGGAVKDACAKLKERLEKCLEQAIESSDEEIPEWLKKWKNTRKWYSMDGEVFDNWKKVVSLAFQERVSLSAQGFFKFPDLEEVDSSHPLGKPFYYFNYAAAVSEVEVDILTGESTILRSDIVYDAGHSLNPAIDIGQIEGGFVQGVGYVTTEELVYDKDGRLLTDGTWEYKPPCSKTIPKDLRVTIYPGATATKQERPPDRIDHITSTATRRIKIDPHGIQSSKAAGEPPLVLANTVFFAIRAAVAEARKEAGLTGQFTLNAPATVEAIQLACAANPGSMQAAPQLGKQRRLEIDIQGSMQAAPQPAAAAKRRRLEIDSQGIIEE